MQERGTRMDSVRRLFLPLFFAPPPFSFLSAPACGETSCASGLHWCTCPSGVCVQGPNRFPLELPSCLTFPCPAPLL